MTNPPLTTPLFREDAYLRETEARVIAHSPEGAIICDASVFYPTGGGQPGDSGTLVWPGGRMAIATALKLPDGQIGLIPAEPSPMPSVGTTLRQVLDWDRRYRHMRMHTALHLLCTVVGLPVTGGQIGTDRSRLDFDMPDPPASLAPWIATLNALIARDLPVSASWISDDALRANPGLIKTMSVSPPTGQGTVRLICIGDVASPTDLQPCGGTHVARTGEIGPVDLPRIENKGRQNRRVSLTFAP